MTPSDQREFLLELEATDEDFVRQKLAFGRYATWQEPIVKYWLEQNDRRRQQERDALHMAVSKRTAFWTRGRTLGGLTVSLVGAIAHWWSGH